MKGPSIKPVRCAIYTRVSIPSVFCILMLQLPLTRIFNRNCWNYSPFRSHFSTETALKPVE